MKNDCIFIFDTNALISAALIKNSISAQALDFAILNGNLVFSESTFSELMSVISRKKFNKYLTESEKQNFVQLMTFAGRFHSPRVSIEASRDVKDNIFLELAIEVDANCIVTGDPDLLILDPFHQIPILNASRFLDRYKIR